MSFRCESSAVAWQRAARGHWLRAFTGLLVAGLVCGGLSAGVANFRLGFTAAVLLITAPLVVLMRAVAGAEAGQAGAVAVEADDLVVTRGRAVTRVPLAQLSAVWIQRAPPLAPREETTEVDVHIQLQSRATAVIRVRDRAEGESLLRAVGLSASDRALRLPLLSDAAAKPPGELLAAIALVFLVPIACIGCFSWVGAVSHTVAVGHGFAKLLSQALPGALMALLALAIHRLVVFLRPTEVLVGRDGLLVRRTWGKELISYESIEAVETVTAGVELTLRGGARRVLPTVDMRRYHEKAAEAAQAWRYPAFHEPISFGRSRWDHEATVADYTRCARAVGRRDALRDRIEQVMALRGARALSAAQIEQLDRRGREVGVWRDELRGLLAGDAEASYRRVRVESDALLAVVEDGGASPALRVAAAVALSGSGELVPRMRIVAQGSADDDLRSALSQAAEGTIDEEALERALERRKA